jgi:cytochrome P450
MSDQNALNYRFNPLDPAVMAAGGAAYSELRARSPFYHFRDGDLQYWITSDYDEVRNYVLQDNPVWSFKWGNAHKDTAHDTGIVTDNPFHNKFRAMLLPGLTPRAMNVLRPQLEAIATELIDRMVQKTRGDFHDEFALPMPARVMCLMLGIPQEDYLQYKQWADELQELMFHDAAPGSHKAIFAKIYEHFMGHVNQRRALLRDAGIAEPSVEHLGSVVPDDYISRSVVSKVDGRPLTDMEIINICATFLTGGQETTTNLLTNCLWRLLEVPERWEQVKANPDLIDVAIEESLRFDPPVLAHFRTSLHATQMHGEDIPEHGKLMFSIAGVNRDPQQFSSPDEFRLDRPLEEVRKHLAFGAGVHFCMGAPVARLEARIALQALIARLPNLRLDGQPERIVTWMYWGRHTMPVRWD